MLSKLETYSEGKPLHDAPKLSFEVVQVTLSFSTVNDHVLVVLSAVTCSFFHTCCRCNDF